MSSSIRDVNKVLFKHMRPYKGRLFVIAVATTLAIVTQIISPWLYKIFFDILTGETEPFYNDAASTLLLLLVAIFSSGFTGNLCWRTAGFTNNFTQPNIMRDTMRTSYDYLVGHSYSFFTSNFTGSLVRRVQRLARSFEVILDQFQWHFLPLVVTITGAIIVVALRFPLMALGMFGWVAAFSLLNVVSARLRLPYAERRAEADSEVTAVLADGITNNLNVKLFNGRQREHDRFGATTQKFKKIQVFTWNLNEINFTIQGILLVVLEFGVMYSALRLWQQGLISVGDFALLQGYVMLLIGKMWDIGRYIKDTYEAYADAKEMVEVLNEPHEVQDSKFAKPLMVKEGMIEFQKVTFAYAKTRKIFDGLSLKIASKEKVAFVGPSGAGKTTIVKLLFRFLDVQRGKILIDGQRISAVTQESLRSQIALVPQEAILFHQSLLENIRYGRAGATDEEVIEAAKQARCHEFIINLPEGYDTLVGERGVKLSGGERQRVAIARAILKNAPILVLDEATSSLDSESEHLIQEALDELMKDKTTIVIAHRLSTIMKMDRILVMEEGKIVDSGSHSILKKKKGTYKKLWEIQVGGFGKG